MSCPPFDLRDYFLKELPDSERRQVETHVQGCPRCQDELQALRLTEAALLSLRDEEVPQRIGFVSDRVFEPSPLLRWWGAFWGSSARLGFASAAMLSVALLVFAILRTAPAPAPRPVTQTIAQTVSPAMEAEIARRVNDAVARVVADSEARQAKRTAELLAAADKRYELDRKGLLLAMDEQYDLMRKRMNRLIVAANDMGAGRGETGGAK
jgi:anti-sigma factor RsiW